MYNVRNVTKDIVWVGASDRRLALFENIFPIQRGVSYNSYVLLDEKTVLLDTVDSGVAAQFFENLEYVLGNRKLDYLIVNHMEPDHCAMIGDIVRRYPEVQIVGNAKTFGMMQQFFGTAFAERAVTVKEGDTVRQAYTSFCDGTDGSLAGGDGDLRRCRQGFVFCRCLWYLRSVKRQYFCG